MHEKILEQAERDGFITFKSSIPEKVKEEIAKRYYSLCAEKRPYIVLYDKGIYADITMDTYCFGPGDLDEISCNEAKTLIRSLSESTKEFQCGKNFFEAIRIPKEDSRTLAKAFNTVANRALERSKRTKPQ